MSVFPTFKERQYNSTMCIYSTIVHVSISISVSISMSIYPCIYIYIIREDHVSAHLPEYWIHCHVSGHPELLRSLLLLFTHANREVSIELEGLCLFNCI